MALASGINAFVYICNMSDNEGCLIHFPLSYSKNPDLIKFTHKTLNNALDYAHKWGSTDKLLFKDVATKLINAVSSGEECDAIAATSCTSATITTSHNSSNNNGAGLFYHKSCYQQLTNKTLLNRQLAKRSNEQVSLVL